MKLVIATLALVAVATATTHAQDRLVLTEYKYDDPSLRSMYLDGSDVQDFFDPGYSIPASDWLTVGLAIDPVGGKIYWTHGSTPGCIRRADLDGSNQEQLVTGLKIPRGLALDPVDGKMYWAAAPPAGNAGGLIQRANLDGSGQETVYEDPDYDPVSSKIGRPTVDAVNGWVYFASNDRILRMNLDGPPFSYHPVITGVSTARSVALDVGNDHIYWIGGDTIEDVVCRARLDNTDYTVVHDMTPDEIVSNGLSDIVFSADEQAVFFCDDLRDQVYRVGVDGSGFDSIYTAPSGFSPAAMTLDVPADPPMQDCNDNGVRDQEDITSGYSDDCNGNGIPDECETRPCAEPDVLHEQVADLSVPGKQLGGAPENQSWIVFQPFDVPADGWEVGTIQVSGMTYQYRPEGFTLTLLPDDGTDYPDESIELAAADGFFRFGVEWITVPVPLTLEEGRYWVRLVANADNHYLATVALVSDGLPSMSRSGLGNDFPGGTPVALRVLAPLAEPGDLNCDGDVNNFDIAPFVLVLTSTPPDYPEYYDQYPDCDHMLADINGDGEVNNFDIAPFVELLTGP